MALSSTEPLATLSDLQSQPLSIIRLSEPISTNPPSTTQSTHLRTSDLSTSTTSETLPTPTSLALDLSHYRDLFSKLRFSYLEQVTKEKFLRAIVGDPPLVVENRENVELENQLKEVKAVLKMQKEDVGRMVEELENRGRALSAVYEDVGLRTSTLERLPGEIEGLEKRVMDLREENEGKLEGLGGLKGSEVGVERIRQMIKQREMEKGEVDNRVRMLQRAIPEKGRQLESLEGELKGLEKEREKVVEFAQEAVRSRERSGGVGNDLELEGRWLSGSEDLLKGWLGVEA
ncbi:MAG: hypothetical protein Q9220_006827 [cf. Caloplaca sp. 1 TL-2023]